MARRRRSLLGVHQAGRKIALTLEAIANMGRSVRVDQGGTVADATIIDHAVVPNGDSLLIRYRLRVRRVGFVWSTADSITFV